ncbi:hypothetical protein [Cognatiluteimonas profundi]|uniref:hypothetical protein n=1 Tax=Cognatiluteimonas profundi TaxID=2594501 RepID=UPI00131BE57B|nr:hypothetical protein [Lysobacter profundi]
MSNNDSPKPGTQEYDLAMAEKYRAQKDGVKDVPLADDGRKADSYDHIRDDDGNVRLSIRRESTVSDPSKPVHFSAEMADPAQLAALEREAARIREELAEVTGYDPKTGEPIMRYTAQQRRARELRLEHLERMEIPALQALQAVASEWRAANVPSTLQVLADEKERRDRLAERAQEIADEREAQALADRIQRQRRS